MKSTSAQTREEQKKMFESDQEEAISAAVRSTLLNIVVVIEEFSDPQDMLLQFRRNRREDEALHREVRRKLMRSKLEALFLRLDRDGSGSLDYREVRMGLKEIGLHVESEDRLQEIFGAVCNKPDMSISLDGLDLLLRIMTGATPPTDTRFAIDVDIVLRALDAHVLASANSDRTKCAAAQKLCGLCKHGDEDEACRRQQFIVEMRGIQILLQCLHTTSDPELQFWCAFAINKVGSGALECIVIHRLACTCVQRPPMEPYVKSIQITHTLAHTHAHTHTHTHTSHTCTFTCRRVFGRARTIVALHIPFNFVFLVIFVHVLRLGACHMPSTKHFVVTYVMGGVGVCLCMCTMHPCVYG